MQQSCDVLIIGAGPAGSSSAALLQKAGFSSMVIEKQQFPRFVIGESLLPHCMDLLQEADLLEAANAREYIIKRGALFLRPDGERCDFNFADQHTKGWDHTWQVPRADFDKTLIDAVESRGVPVYYQHEVKAVDVNRHEPVVTVADPSGVQHQVQCRFLIDASGYGRVLPRLLDLDEPSRLPMRKAVLGHLKGDQRPPGGDTNRIWILILKSGGWAWIIPFSNGITSFGVVGGEEVFAQYPRDEAELLRHVIETEPNCARLLNTEWVLSPRTIGGYSCSVKRLYGDNFCLVGNATEFLDPVFSSGVTLALESANRATKAVIRQLRGEAVDWDRDYAVPMKNGTNVFRTYVTTWYDGTLPKIFFAETVNAGVKNMICSVLAGYVWDETNPFVAQHDRKVAQLSRVIAGQEA
jgi:flavin-dependent dehydrogenase